MARRLADEEHFHSIISMQRRLRHNGKSLKCCGEPSSVAAYAYYDESRTAGLKIIILFRIGQSGVVDH